MYVFLSGAAAAAREGGWEGTGKAGVEGGKEGKESVLLPLANSAPQIWGREDWGRWSSRGRGRTSGPHTPLSSGVFSLLWHRYASAFILIYCLYLFIFASLKKWRTDLHKLSGTSPSHLPPYPPLPPTPSLRHPAPTPQKRSHSGVVSAESQGESGQGERATSVVGK